jgi:sterol desaturase/sphingolipid hydroxylase (fatty acid hydroxylase superfamily)
MSALSESLAAIPVGTAKAALGYAAFALLFAAAERLRHGLSPRRYLRRAVLNDYLYCVFFNGGYFTLLAYPFVKTVEVALSPFRLDLLPNLPLPVATIAFFVIADFSFYWAHRLLHTRWFWRFHRIHHSQTEMTTLTTARFHVVDVLVLTIVTLVPAALLGWPAETIVLVSFLLALQDRMQHSALDLTYGIFYPVIVSPRYHRIHHAPDQARGNSNFGRLLPLWDRLFGTAHANAERPERVGVEGEPLPENVIAHFIAPFRDLLPQGSGARRRDVVAATASPPLSSPSPGEAAGEPAEDASGSIR